MHFTPCTSGDNYGKPQNFFRRLKSVQFYIISGNFKRVIFICNCYPWITFSSTSFCYNIDEMPWNLILVYINQPMVKVVSLCHFASSHRTYQWWWVRTYSKLLRQRNVFPSSVHTISYNNLDSTKSFKFQNANSSEYKLRSNQTNMTHG